MKLKGYTLRTLLRRQKKEESERIFRAGMDHDIGCWTVVQVREAWKKAGSPKRVTAPKIARAALAQKIPRWYAFRWCVTLLDDDRRLKLLDDLELVWSHRFWNSVSGDPPAVSGVCDVVNRWTRRHGGTWRKTQARWKKVLGLIADMDGHGPSRKRRS